MASGLLRLPFEILSQICQTWCSHCTDEALGAAEGNPTASGPWAKNSAVDLDDGWAGGEGHQSTLAHLSRACKHLRAVAQPVLYHAFATRRHHDLFLFVRTLLQRPDLCPHVRRVSISTSGSGWVYRQDEVARFAHHAQQLGLPLSSSTLALLTQTRTWDVGDGSASVSVPERSRTFGVDAVVLKDLVALLLPLVPHVKVAYVQVLPLPREAVNSSDSSQQILIRLLELTSLCFSPRAASTPSWFSQPDPSPIIVCPKLVFLHLRFCTTSPTFGHGITSVAGNQCGPVTLPGVALQYLSVLCITRCRVSRTFLEDILAGVGSQLRSFVLVLGYPWIVENHGRILPDDITPKQVIDNLLPWAETLRAVRIDLSKAMPRAIKLRKADLITSASQFSRLEVLELDLSCVYIAELEGLLMFGVDTAQADWDLLVNLLPQCIREFVLNGPTHRVYDALEELSDRAASGSFTDLVKVRCDDGPVAHLEHLRDRFGIAGVDFSLLVPKYGFRQTLSDIF